MQRELRFLLFGVQWREMYRGPCVKKKDNIDNTIRWEGLFWLARRICWFGGKKKKFLSWEEPFKWSHISPLTMGNEAGKTIVNGQKSFMGFHLKQMPQAGEQVRLSSVLQSCLKKWLGSGWIEVGDLHHGYILSPDTTHYYSSRKC